MTISITAMCLRASLTSYKKQKVPEHWPEHKRIRK